MKPKSKAAALLALGFIVIFAGFIYDILFAGIPYQDPTPVMLASYNLHAQIASIIRWSGVLIFIAGIIATFIHKRNAK